MDGNIEIPPIRMAEVFVDGHCVGFLSDVKLSRENDGGFNLEGEWSGYSDVLDKESMFTISIPRYECRFLTDRVEADLENLKNRISFRDASFIPDGPKKWFEELDK
jgi:hypothetical protein